jgi:hypothetical protein
MTVESNDIGAYLRWRDRWRNRHGLCDNLGLDVNLSALDLLIEKLDEVMVEFSKM